MVEASHRRMADPGVGIPVGPVPALRESSSLSGQSPSATRIVTKSVDNQLTHSNYFWASASNRAEMERSSSGQMDRWAGHLQTIHKVE